MFCAAIAILNIKKMKGGRDNMAITRKELLNKMNEQRVSVTYEGMRTVCGNEALKQSILIAMAEQNIPISELYEDDRIFKVRGQVAYKGKLIQGDTGVFRVRSKDYIFCRDRDSKDVYGDIPKMSEMDILPDGTGFTKKLNDRENITYRLILK